MKYNPDIHHRRSIRLKEYDYAQAGAYFVTVCTQGREDFFGEIKNGEMVLNGAGKMVQTAWDALPERFPEIELDEFMVMPNHVHGIIVMGGAPLVSTVGGAPGEDRTDAKNRAGTRPAPTLGEIVGVFKSITTLEYVRAIKRCHWPPFPGRLWQRNYFEHIIRNEKTLAKIREYIVNNPQRWRFDRENPAGRPDKTEQDFWEQVG
ncbi:MAG: hypothetical protein L0Z48_00785 [candidate division Zixibacteria bacterium]|nr:hypothetical protein [candidate division Zixibacteria bacterium]